MLNFNQLFHNQEILDGKNPDRPEPDSFSEKIRQRMIKSNEEPFCAKMARILFISMLVLTAAMVLGELVSFLQYPQLGWSRFLSNLSFTALIIWTIYSVLLVICCCFGISFNYANDRKRQSQMGILSETPEALSRRRRALRRLNHTYHLFLATSLIGILVWLAFYFLVSLSD